MCGIFGSNDFERYITLYELNKDRGNFAYGSLYTYNDTRPLVFRHEVDTFLSWNVEGYADCTFYFGHTQGPTSAQRDFNPFTSHPFKYLSWHVAHNGVLSNSQVLAEKYKVDNPVDSVVIPVIIWNKMQELYDPDIWIWEREQEAIKLACEELEGTFSCWLYNEKTNNTYLIRCGSTLFAGDREFSSAKLDDMEPLDDGSIYRLFHDTNSGQEKWLQKVEEFKTSSPFFIL